MNQNIIQNIFTSLGGIHVGSDGRIQKIRIVWDHVKDIMKNWSGNRDTDEGRVRSITEAMQTGHYINNDLFVARLENEGIVCFDGNHRREAYRRLPDPDRMVYINFLEQSTQEEVRRYFEDLNQGVSVPRMYTEKQNPVIITQIKRIVETITTRFKTYNFASSCATCRAPHFIRDQFQNDIYDIYISRKETTPVDTINKALWSVNENYTVHPHPPKLRGKALAKCQKSGFWLFQHGQFPKADVTAVLDAWEEVCGPSN